MKVLMVEPGKIPHEADIEPGLRSLQAAVDGYGWRRGVHAGGGCEGRPEIERRPYRGAGIGADTAEESAGV